MSPSFVIKLVNCFTTFTVPSSNNKQQLVCPIIFPPLLLTTSFLKILLFSDECSSHKLTNCLCFLSLFFVVVVVFLQASKKWPWFAATRPPARRWRPLNYAIPTSDRRLNWSNATRIPVRPSNPSFIIFSFLV